MPMISLGLKKNGMPLTKKLDRRGENDYTLITMKKISTEGLSPTVSTKATAFLDELLGSGYADNIHSFTIVGSALAGDFDEKASNIDSVIVLKEMDLRFIEFLAPLGKRFRKKGIGAPLIMTPDYITTSLDVFPIEFLNFKLIHTTVYGDDLFDSLDLEKRHLRLQCERDVKAKLIWLRQGYISSLGDRKLLSERLADSITGYIPLFRAIIFLLGKEPPFTKHDVVKTLQELTRIETGIFERILLLRHKKVTLSSEELTASFEQYYRGTEKIATIIDELTL
ncbi:MAG: hypothetical protein ACE5D4_10860 [Thermodesulfobacteriota bacterium]